MVTMVLLNVALMWAMPRLTLRLCLRFLLFATVVPSPRASGKRGPAPVLREAGPRPVMLPRSAPERHGGRSLPAGYLSLTPFFPATVLRGPLRVRALVRVR